MPSQWLNILFVVCTHFGLPKESQSDRGVNFTYHLFKQMLADVGIAHVLSSAYHPQPQGALERHHHTLKTKLCAFCSDSGKDWDLAVPFVVFAVREVQSESLGFSPNEPVSCQTTARLRSSNPRKITSSSRVGL